MIIFDLSPTLRRHVAYALRERCSQLKQNGLVPPPELIELAEALYPSRSSPDRHAEPDPDERRKALAAGRTARWRARQRGEPVPLRRPGPSREPSPNGAGQAL